MKIHELKTWPDYFQAINDGDKSFEYRKNDRGFKKGDHLRLREYDPDKQRYTGREITAEITYILENQMGVADGYAVMSINIISIGGLIMARKFKWDSWDFDCDGDAYVIAKDECPEKEKVPDYIIQVDCLHPDCKDGMVIEDGWCKYQVRTDWDNGDGEPQGGYCVDKRNTRPIRLDGRKKPGWFPVWIVRKGEWY